MEKTVDKNRPFGKPRRWIEQVKRTALKEERHGRLFRLDSTVLHGQTEVERYTCETGVGDG